MDLKGRGFSAAPQELRIGIRPFADFEGSRDIHKL